MPFDPIQLAGLPLFAGIRPEDLPAMLSCLGGFEKSYQKDEILLLESRQVRQVGVMLAGTVWMIQEDDAGNRTLLAEMRRGELFGESFSCGSRPYACVSFVAGSACTVLFLPFQRVLHSCRLTCAFHHRLIENMVLLLSDKNIQLMQKIQVVSQKTLRKKILAYLHQQAAARGSRRFTVPFGRMELAEYLCADRCALTRELAAMQRDGLILYHKNTFQLL